MARCESCGFWKGFCRREFLIVEIRLLNENRVPVKGVQPTIKTSSINNGLLGRRLMVGQVPLEHFV
jgi:hypothetical protein